MQPLVSPTPSACAADAEICPDGTVFNRQGPNCQFPSCPSPQPRPMPKVPPAIIHDQDVDLFRPVAGQHIFFPMTVEGTTKNATASMAVKVVDGQGKLVLTKKLTLKHTNQPGSWYFVATFSAKTTTIRGLVSIIEPGVAHTQDKHLIDIPVFFQ